MDQVFTNWDLTECKIWSWILACFCLYAFVCVQSPQIALIPQIPSNWYNLALRWSLSLNETLLGITNGVEDSKTLYVYPCQWFGAFLPISLNCPNAQNTIRQEQVNLLVYGPSRPYYKQTQKNTTQFWPTGFFLIYYFLLFEKK